MEIKEINIQKFKGINTLSHKFTDTVTVLNGPVGSGKTSFIQALRMGITGETPINPIKAGESSTTVSIVSDDDVSIEREIMKPNKKTVRIVGRKVGMGASEKFLEELTNVGNEIMKIATSSEVLSSLKPSEFGGVFLNGSEEKTTIKEMLKFFEKIDSKEKKAVLNAGTAEAEEELPIDVISDIKDLFKEKVITLEAINKAYAEAKQLKRERTALYKNAYEKSKDFLDISKPEYSEKELQKKLEEIIGVEKNIESYKEAVKNYNDAFEAKKAQEKNIARLELSIEMNKGTLPNPAHLTKILGEKADLQNKVIEQEKVKQSLSDSIKRLKLTLDKLDKPFCPISEHILCKTDKTDFKEDLEFSLFQTQESADTINKTIAELKVQLWEREKEEEAYRKNKENHDKKLLLIKELNSLKEKPIKLPTKPEKFDEKKDYSTEKAKIQEKLDLLRRYKDCEADYRKSVTLKRLCVISDFIVKSLEPKGPIINSFIETFAKMLEEACNERAKLLKTGFELKFVAEDGLKVFFKTNPEAEFLAFNSLSAGERIFAELILTDLINSFYNSRILILDDTDHLDAQSFKLLLGFVTREDIKELYDNIIISCVSHDDIIELIESYPVDRIEF